MIPSAPAARDSSPPPLTALADHLAARTAHILQAWRGAVSADSRLTTADGLSRTQFLDHIPRVLQSFARSLRGEAAAFPAEAILDGSVDHGQHRWRQGYDLREVILEWGHLLRCLLDELEVFQAACVPVDPAALLAAQRALAGLVNEAIADSAEQYGRLQQKEAIQVRDDLERELASLTASNQRKAAILRESAHDLRGQLNVIMSATSLLDDPTLEEALRVESFDILTKSVRTLKEMLVGLLDEAQAIPGPEQRRLGGFDAAALLGGLCAASQPLARERNLFLRSTGPEELPVEGDRSKVQRIAQNLLLNALAYTARGGVTLSWREDSPDWWSFQVRDTGPGLPAQNLDPTNRAADAPRGEGIGLTIVRRLCHVLGADLQTATGEGAGTTFTVTLPRRYAA